MDFLALSRANPLTLSPFSEPLKRGGELQVWDTGVICIEPPTPASLDLVLSCGIHGNETAPIELCERLLKAIISGELICRQRLLLIFGNLPAINLGVRQVEENLNRLFSGAHRQGELNQERSRAALLEQYVTCFYNTRPHAERVHYDLHTAIRASHYEKFAIYPYLPTTPYARSQLAFLQHSAIDTVLLAQAPVNTFSCYSAHQHGAHALTIELGQVQPFGHNDAQRVVELEHNLCRLLDTPSWQPPLCRLDQLRIYKVAQEITKQSEQFRFHFSDDIPNFTSFAPATLLAVDGARQWRVGEVAESVVFPNAGVALEHRAALMVVRTAFHSSQLD